MHINVVRPPLESRVAFVVCVQYVVSLPQVQAPCPATGNAGATGASTTTARQTSLPPRDSPLTDTEEVRYKKEFLR